MFQIPLIASLKVRKQHSITEADVFIKKMSGQDLNPQTPGLVQWTLQLSMFMSRHLLKFEPITRHPERVTLLSHVHKIKYDRC